MRHTIWVVKGRRCLGSAEVEEVGRNATARTQLAIVAQAMYVSMWQARAGQLKDEKLRMAAEAEAIEEEAKHMRMKRGSGRKESQIL